MKRERGSVPGRRRAGFLRIETGIDRPKIVLVAETTLRTGATLAMGPEDPGARGGYALLAEIGYAELRVIQDPSHDEIGSRGSKRREAFLCTLVISPAWSAVRIKIHADDLQ